MPTTITTLDKTKTIAEYLKTEAGRVVSTGIDPTKFTSLHKNLIKEAMAYSLGSTVIGDLFEISNISENEILLGANIKIVNQNGEYVIYKKDSAGNWTIELQRIG